MRYIIIVLMLANIGYFAWNYSNPTPVTAEPATSAPRPLLNTGLTLISEFDAATSEIALDARRQCSLVSGFASMEEAQSFMQEARNMRLEALLQSEQSGAAPQYRVYLPPTPSREIANLTLEDLSERLAAAELSVETYLITRGELENAVALGVFASREGAETVQSQVFAMGYTPFIEEITAAEGDIQVWLRPVDSLRVEQPEWLDLSAENGALSRSENLCQTIAQASQFQ